jgi:5-methylcytosine-specific restriction endonuclease McrA
MLEWRRQTERSRMAPGWNRRVPGTAELEFSSRILPTPGPANRRRFSQRQGLPRRLTAQPPPNGSPAMASAQYLTSEPRFEEFLSAVRVGIDLGEFASGIAVVQDKKILHAETCLDFHSATLEQRRTLRRARRTRHSKKMRLARLRSWVLRQRLNNQTRLPDPYEILRRHPAQRRSAAGLIEAITAKEESSPEAFVGALVAIFRKRGYKFDDRKVSELSDIELEEFLNKARVSGALAEQIKAEIERREKEPDDTVRGQKRRSPAELQQLLSKAECLKREPRVAEPRETKEEDLRKVVRGFCLSHGLDQQTCDRWQTQLVRLLNKVIRPAHFDNRLRSGCSWCGKATPRKKKVRERAFRAAVHNLRMERGRGRIEPEQLNKILAWWDDRQNAPSLKEIEAHLRSLGAKAAMARQLYDLLKNEKPAGRASLCVVHLKMAAEGKTMKDAGVDWQTIAPRRAVNPCREQRDARLIARLEAILFKPGERGAQAWRFGAVKFITLEAPEPRTDRARRGEQRPREVLSLADRLKQELNGRCLYCCALSDGDAATATELDHIFPRSRGGPDLRENLAPACPAHNKEKDKRTPFQWLGQESSKWERFKRQINTMSLPPRKKELLLWEQNEYPDNPTPLAHVGSRPREFIVKICELFEKHGVPIPTVDYQSDKPHIQRVPGWLTDRLRRSWMCKQGEETKNFPYPKSREDLYNHAQDAALLAACPPHTWRERIFTVTARRPTADQSCKDVPGLALAELAPDWAGFDRARRECRAPLVRALGRYRISWKTSFADVTFGRNPENLGDKKLIIRKPLEQLQGKDVKNVICARWRAVLEKLKSELSLQDKEAFPVECLHKELPRVRRLRLHQTKGGTLARVAPSDGPPRKIQVKPASEGVLLWEKENMVGFSIIRPRPASAFGLKRLDPPPPAGSRRVAMLYRHQIFLNPQDGNFYRLTKFARTRVTAVMENVVPRFITLQNGERGAAQTDPSRRKERTFSARQLADLIKARRGGQSAGV